MASWTISSTPSPPSTRPSSSRNWRKGPREERAGAFLTVAEAIAASGIDRREARLLLAEVAGFSEASIAASPGEEVPFEVENAFLGLVDKRKAGIPVAYLLGRKEFYSLDLAVNPSVLIPRPETELLVDLALERDPGAMLDLGTGSGAIALAVKFNRRGTRVVASDADSSALQTARRNAVKLGLDVDFRHGRWFEPVTGERFDLVVSNPPYIAEEDPHLPALRYEPRLALVAGTDGLDCIRDIARQALAHLSPGGWLLLEHGQGQDGAVREILRRAGLESVRTWPDLAGIPRVTGGTGKV
jgi:release factor glutamine methyltransferase